LVTARGCRPSGHGSRDPGERWSIQRLPPLEHGLQTLSGDIRELRELGRRELGGLESLANVHGRDKHDRLLGGGSDPPLASPGGGLGGGRTPLWPARGAVWEGVGPPFGQPGGRSGRGSDPPLACPGGGLGGGRTPCWGARGAVWEGVGPPVG